MTARRVLVVGAGGKLGLRLVVRGLAHGHRVTAFVRNPQTFTDRLAGLSSASIPTVQGDALDVDTLATAMSGHDVVVSAAGTARDGASFAELFQGIFNVATRTLPAPCRVWMVASTAVLTIPHANVIAAGLPGVPRMHRMHEADWELMERSGADWSLMCPGPMVAAGDCPLRSDMRVSIDVVPFEVPRWAGWAPGIALSLLMKRRLGELSVTYEDVAGLMMTNLTNGGPYCRHRVGISRPRDN